MLLRRLLYWISALDYSDEEKYDRGNQKYVNEPSYRVTTYKTEYPKN